MPCTVDLRGSATIKPSQGSALTKQVSVDFNATRTYAREVGMSLAASGTDGTPVALQLGSITRVRFFTVRVTGGEVRFRFTTPDGTAQVIPVTGLLIIDNPSEGSQITAITMAVDSAGPSLEFVAAGDET